MLEPATKRPLYGSFAHESVIEALEGKDHSTESERLALAEAYIHARRFSRSLALTRTLVNSERFGIQGQILSARAFIGIGNVQGAVDQMLRLAAAHGHSTVPADLTVLVARHLSSQGSIGAAVNFLEMTGAQDDPNITALHAILLARLRRCEEAAEMIGKRLISRTKAPSEAELHVLYARLQMLLKHFAPATTHFQYALDRVLPDPRRYYHAARAAFRANRLGLADRWITLAVTFGFDGSTCRKLMGQIRLAAGNYPAAAEAFHSSLKMHKNRDTQLLLVIAFVRARNYPAAFENLTDLLESDPNNLETLLWHVKLLREMGASKDAELAATRLARDFPLSADALSILGEIKVERGAHAEAAGHFRAASALHPEDTNLAQLLTSSEVSARKDRINGLVKQNGTNAKPGAAAVIDQPLSTFRARWRPEDLIVSEHIFSAMRTEGRVLFALIVREMRSRFPLNRIGYVLAFVDPTMQVVIHAVFWGIIGTVPLAGMSTPVFLVAGFTPFFLFQNTFSRTMNANKFARSLLFHKRITMFDMSISKSILELPTMFIVFCGLLLVFKIMGDPFVVQHPLEILTCFIFLWVMGFGAGLFLEGMSPLIGDSGRVLVTTFIRSQYYIAGIFIAPQSWPPKFMDYLIWNPCLQLLEIIREDLSPIAHLRPLAHSTAPVNTVSLSFCAAWALGILLLGLVAHYAFRRELLER